MKSLTRQTLAIVVAGQLVCAAMLCGAALQHERHTRVRALDAQIQGRSDSLLGAVQDAEDPEDNVTIDPAELRLPPQDVYAVYNQGGRSLGSSINAPAELVRRVGDGFRDAQADGRSYRVLQREAMRIIDRAEFGGVGLRRPVTIVYAVPEEHVWHETFDAVRFYLIAIAFATSMAVLLVAGMLRRALQPLSELADAAAMIAAPDLHFQAPPSALQLQELRPLTNVLRELTDRLRESFAREQRFVSDAAHELKTAIAVVRSSVQVLMLKLRPAEEYRTGLDRILEDTGRVEALVTQMLQLARLEEGQRADHPVIDLGDTVQSVTKLLNSVAEQRGLHIEAENSRELLVRLHPESAEVLLSNLLLNAVQHSKAGARIRVSARRHNGTHVLLKVEDKGPGIAPEALPYIFDRFYREDSSRSRDTGGTGLGLAICKSIVESAGGTIQAASTPGAGTTMTVTFMSA